MAHTVPITVLTGYLGAGKTTLLNRILSAQHGKRIAVIVNEFGELGIDHQLVVATDDELIEMNNGCICCTVRADLIGAIQRILEREVDMILIETTGLADPAPIIQSFFLDDRIQRATSLDAMITVVDARHIALHWETEEAKEQIAFADVLLLNKCDLVSVDELAQLNQRIAHMNPLAKVYQTEQCDVPLEQLLDLGAFDLKRALSIEPRLLEELTHEHDSSIGAVCLRSEGAIDGGKLTRWLMELGQTRAADLFRLKGILNVDDERRRFVLHGVHMLLDGRPGLPWKPGELRHNQLVFIGRGLQRAELERSFAACHHSQLAELAS